MPKKNNRKRRGKKEGSVFQMPNGKWRAQISIQGLNGKRRRVTRTGKTKEHAVLLLSELQAERPSFVTAGESMMIAGYLNSWLEILERSKSLATYTVCKGMVNNHIAPKLGNIRIDALNMNHVEQWLKEMEVQPTGCQHKAFEVLRTAMRDACRKGILKSDPTEFCNSPKHTKKPILPFSQKEAKKILKEAKPNRLAGVFELGLKAGMRQEEIFGLQWMDVFFEEKTVHVRLVAAEAGGRVVIKEPKTKSSKRYVSLPKSCVKVLNNRLTVANSEGFDSPTDHVFPTLTGTPIRRTNFGRREWTPLLKTLGIPHRGFHHCRHTAATIMLRANVPIFAVAAQLGHSSPKVTMDIYAHWLPNDKDKAAKAMQAAFK